MNYLAHLFLAGESPESRVGNLQGDFMRGVDRQDLTNGVWQGVLMHRRVDAFTDAHALFRQSRQRLAPEYRRWSGVLINVFYDHLLALHWQQFSPEQSLPEFAASIYATLAEHSHLLAGRLARVAPKMAAGDWLSAYAERASLDLALAGISRRLRRPSPLAQAGPQLDLHFSELQEDFLQFFPELRARFPAVFCADRD